MTLSNNIFWSDYLAKKPPLKVMLNLEQKLGGERPSSAFKMTRAKTAPEIKVPQKKVVREISEDTQLSPTKSAPKIPSGNGQINFL